MRNGMTRETQRVSTKCTNNIANARGAVARHITILRTSFLMSSDAFEAINAGTTAAFLRKTDFINAVSPSCLTKYERIGMETKGGKKKES